MLRYFRDCLILKQEATKPAFEDFLQRQERFEDYSHVDNKERSHRALGGTPVWCRFPEKIASIVHVCSSPNRYSA